MTRKERFKNIENLKTNLTPAPNSSNEIKLSLIRPNPYQPRFNEEVEELKESIKSDGQLQSILLMVHENQYYIVGGHRRFKACSELGLETIRADVNKLITMADMQRLALIENIQREQLQALEIALVIDELLSSGAYEKQDHLADDLGKSKVYVSKMLSILKLEEEILQHLKENRLSIGLEVLHELQGIKQPASQVSWFHKYIDGSTTVAGIRDFKKRLKEALPAPATFKNVSNKRQLSLTCNWNEWESDKKEEFEEELSALLKRFES